MAVMNTYNYAKPKGFVRVDLGTQPMNARHAANARPESPAFAGKTDQYLESKILSAKPEELTFMLYEGMVRFIKKAMLSLEQLNYEKTNEFTKRAQDILAELRSTLNMDIPLSHDLDILYEYTEFTLFEANIGKNLEKYAAALEMAEEFKQTWQQAFGLSG